MKSWTLILMLTACMLVYQNCGANIQLPEGGTIAIDGTVIHLKPTITEANVQLPQSAAANSLQATLYTALSNYKAINNNSSITQSETNNGHNLTIENSDQWLVCNFDRGGTSEASMIETMVFKYACSMSLQLIENSSAQISFLALELLYNSQQNALNNGQSFSILMTEKVEDADNGSVTLSIDDSASGSYSCTAFVSGSFQCEYIGMHISSL